MFKVLASQAKFDPLSMKETGNSINIEVFVLGHPFLAVTLTRGEMLAKGLS